MQQYHLWFVFLNLLNAVKLKACQIEKKEHPNSTAIGVNYCQFDFTKVLSNTTANTKNTSNTNKQTGRLSWLVHWQSGSLFPPHLDLIIDSICCSDDKGHFSACDGRDSTFQQQLHLKDNMTFFGSTPCINTSHSCAPNQKKPIDW